MRSVSRILIVLTAAVASLHDASAATAPPTQRRRVAVLEYRGGVDSAPNLAEQIAVFLKRNAALEIVDQREARRRSQSVDGDVARCSGDAGCTARAGRKINVDEVLLVAMSQLGDLVVNLQRVDVSTGKNVVPSVSAVLPSGKADEDKIEGWMRQLYPPELFVQYGRIAITANVEGAVISLNGKVYGETPLDGPLRVLAPRAYRVSLTKKGRVPFSARIEVVPDSTFEVNAELPEAQQATPWYKRWYPWAIVGAVAVGAGAGTVIYFTRPDDKNVTGEILGWPR